MFAQKAVELCAWPYETRTRSHDTIGSRGPSTIAIKRAKCNQMSHLQIAMDKLQLNLLSANAANAIYCNDMQWPMDNGHHEAIRARTEVPRCARRPRHVDWRPFWRSQREPHDQQPALESLEFGELKTYLRSLMFFLKTSNGYWMEHVQYLFIIFD